MSCFGKETRPFPRFFLLLGAVRVTDMEIRMSPNSGMKLTCRWTVCGSMAFSSVSVCTKDGYKLYWDKSPMCEISFFFVSVGGGRDMGDSRSGRLDVLTICKMRRADYEISSNNMWTYRP